ncbi:hypothetical protein ACJW31_01G164700 [Castanea mollissima]
MDFLLRGSKNRDLNNIQELQNPNTTSITHRINVESTIKGEAVSDFFGPNFAHFSFNDDHHRRRMTANDVLHRLVKIGVKSPWQFHKIIFIDKCISREGHSSIGGIARI